MRTKTKKPSLLLGILLVFFTGFSQDNYRIPEDSKTILFLGNSITYAGHYISYTEAYLKVRYPDRNWKFINIGLPSETVSGLSEENHANGKFPRPDLHERLDRILKQIQPDLVFSCYGMNDGIYLPFDNSRFQKYQEGIQWLDEKVKKTAAAIVHITPTNYEKKGGEAYANVLDLYSDWLISNRVTNKWKILDWHWPLKTYVEKKRIENADFGLTTDGVHPLEQGHWLMAQQLLLYLGETSVANVSSALEALSEIENGKELLELIEQRQLLQKNAWLTATRHKRPGIRLGLPLKEAEEKCEQIEIQLQKILQ
jgi:lysophospholipase L1-like esterase